MYAEPIQRDLIWCNKSSSTEGRCISERWHIDSASELGVFDNMDIEVSEPYTLLDAFPARIVVELFGLTATTHAIITLNV
jgi:hypothetical protein